MKTKRHAKILELISSHAIDTQEELLKQLKEAGFEVTQATVSRDIKELRLIKALSADGQYCYTVHQQTRNSDISNKFKSLFSEAVTSMDFAMNIVVIKCHVGMANAVCAALDAMHWNGVVGTLAGDDTIMIVTRDEARAVDFVNEVTKLVAR